MKSLIPRYSTYDEAVEDLANLQNDTLVTVDETLRIYRVTDGVEKTLEPVTNGANFSLSGTTLSITF